MAAICRENNMPEPQTILDWMERFPEIHTIIARARAQGFDVIAADCLAIADNAGADYVATEDGARLDAENIQRSKLRVETRLKLLAKWDPKRYGDIGATNNVNVGVVVSGITEDQRAQILEKKQQAIEWQKQHRTPLKLINGSNGNGTNGTH